MKNSVIKENIRTIKNTICIAAKKAGNNPEQIKLIAVTKNISTDFMEQVLEEGISDFAENKVQELLKKYDIFSDRCNWHFIGRLQTNKVKYIVDKVSLIHSVDRIDLVEEINKRAVLIDKCIDVLVQINVSGELTKAGVKKDLVISFLKKISEFSNIKIRGLMTMAPQYDEAERSRWIFKEITNLAIDIKKENIHNVSMDFLSMGMSGDFEIAIEEGANIVRVGSAIFK
jgi:pyridoxal phosphate enzyme (YggS family)